MSRSDGSYHASFRANSFISLFAEGDIGGFGVSSDLTWQINAGAQLKLGRHFYGRLTWRHQETDLEDDGFIYDVRKSGPNLNSDSDSDHAAVGQERVLAHRGLIQRRATARGASVQIPKAFANSLGS